MSVSKKTMRLLRPTPVKYALPWTERREPSITNTPLDEKPQRCSSASVRCLSSSSDSGVNLLKRGAMKVGHAQVTKIVKPTQTSHASTHHHSPARSIKSKITKMSGAPSKAPSSKLLKRSAKNNFSVIRLKPKRASMPNVRHSDRGKLTIEMTRRTV